MRLMILALMIVGCGEQAANTEKADSSQNAYLTSVNTSGELPACTKETEGRIIYIKANAVFNACNDLAWSEIDLRGAKGEKGDVGGIGEKGDQGAAGITVASNRSIDASDTDFCSDISKANDVNCYFVGGQIITFSDGSILIDGTFVYESFILSPDLDTNFDTANVTAFLSSNMNRSQTLMSIRARPVPTAENPSNWADIWLTYERKTDKAAIGLDKSGDGILQKSTEIVENLVISEWVISKD